MVPIQEISVKAVKKLQDQEESFLLLDIRDQWERELVKIEDSEFMPMDTVPLHFSELNRSIKIVIYCHTGMRSSAVTSYLMNQGFENVMNMAGGINAWALEIDPSMLTY